MAIPRYKQVNLDVTPYYHCMNRCVRQAFLCGVKDGKSYEHRRSWIEERILFLSQYFMIDVVSYAVMHNHYHVILAVDTEGARKLSAKEILTRWHSMFKGDEITRRYLNGESIPKKLNKHLIKKTSLYRRQLTDISWFMRCTNQYIASKANKEDDCRGRFWEGRFVSQALVDEKALLSCMAYVDLNPVRAKVSTKADESKYTSIKARVENKAKFKSKMKQKPTSTKPLLMPFRDEVTDKNSQHHLPINYQEYIDLVNWSSECIQDKKFMTENARRPLLLKSNGFNPNHWIYCVRNFQSAFKTLVGSLYSLSDIPAKFGIKRVSGKSACGEYLGL